MEQWKSYIATSSAFTAELLPTAVRFTPVKEDATLAVSDCAQKSNKQMRLVDHLARLVDA